MNASRGLPATWQGEAAMEADEEHVMQADRLLYRQAVLAIFLVAETAGQVAQGVTFDA